MIKIPPFLINFSLTFGFLPPLKIYLIHLRSSCI